MSEFRDSELRRLDLTVLLVFLGLLRHRKAVAVAAELGLTQSGVSQALRRLRDVFGDPLFLRRPHGMDPTAVALRLEAPVAAAVEALRGALGAGAGFEAATARRVFRVAALDAEQAAVIPGLVAALARDAPGVQVAVLPLAWRAAVEALQAGAVDLALGFLWDLPDFVQARVLMDQGFLVVARPALLAEPMTLARYAGLPHVLVSPGGDLRGVADRALEAAGLARRVVAAVPQFFPALAAVAGSDCVVTLPERLARAYAPLFGLGVAEPPLELRRFPVMAVRHVRNARDAGVDWLEARVAAAMG
jgi:DNA-binding transcriptional LysR family regulator